MDHRIAPKPGNTREYRFLLRGEKCTIPINNAAVWFSLAFLCAGTGGVAAVASAIDRGGNLWEKRQLVPHFLTLTSIVSSFVSTVVLAQTAQQGPQFDVASIKASSTFTPTDLAEGKVRLGMRVSHTSVEIGFMPLAGLIALAYRLERYQILGPPWMTISQPYDIVARTPEGAAKEDVPEMLQALLAERFKLVAHRSTREQLVYALVADKGGVNLKESPSILTPMAPNSTTRVTADYKAGESQVKAVQRGSERDIFISTGSEGQIKMTTQQGITHLEASGMTMAGLAKVLTPQLDRPVVDMTGLKGQYEIAIDLSTRSASYQSGSDIAPQGNSLEVSISSIRSSLVKLGLRLDQRRAPIKILVVDRVEKSPTAN